MKSRIFSISILIFIISFLNFQFNFFEVVSNQRFENFQAESAQNVLDGYLNFKLNDDNLRLGQFKRPSIDMFQNGDQYKPREWYNDEFIEGDFWEYKSNYGIQLKLFSFFNGNIIQTQIFISILFSLFITIIFFKLSQLHSLKFSLIFVLAFIFNPWITPIARNEFFIPFTYLFPFLITSLYYKSITKSNRKFFIMLLLLYVTFLLKSLAGYEFYSTVVLTCMIPITFYYLKNNFSKIDLAIKLFLVSLVCVFSFMTAILIHSNSLDTQNPLRSIYLNASKRISSNNPQKLAYDTCFDLLADEKGNFNPSVNNNERDCINEIINSLSVNRIQVLTKYMIARRIIPFFGSREINLTIEQEKVLKDIYYDDSQGVINKGKNSFNYFLKNYSSFNLLEVFAVIVNFIFSPILFIAIFLIYFVRTFNSSNNEKLFNLFVLAPPLSWFILAKGHSYISAYQLTFFIWFLPTIPYMLAIIISKNTFK
jgi:hypothetical protein